MTVPVARSARSPPTGIPAQHTSGFPRGRSMIRDRFRDGTWARCRVRGWHPAGSQL